MYRKQADRLIVRDIRKRLGEMPEPHWERALVVSMSAHPDWYRHHADPLKSVAELLAAAGLERVHGERK